MSRGPCTFTEADVARACRGATKAGLVVHRIEIDRAGKIVVVTDKPTPSNGNDASQNEWDVPLAGKAQQ